MSSGFCEKVRSEVSMGHVFRQCDLTAIPSVRDKARDGVGRAKVSYEPRLLICPVADIFFCGELGFQSAGTEESLWVMSKLVPFQLSVCSSGSHYQLQCHT